MPNKKIARVHKCGRRIYGLTLPWIKQLGFDCIFVIVFVLSKIVNKITRFYLYINIFLECIYN